MAGLSDMIGCGLVENWTAGSGREKETGTARALKSDKALFPPQGAVFVFTGWVPCSSPRANMRVCTWHPRSCMAGGPFLIYSFPLRRSQNLVAKKGEPYIPLRRPSKQLMRQKKWATTMLRHRVWTLPRDGRPHHRRLYADPYYAGASSSFLFDSLDRHYDLLFLPPTTPRTPPAGHYARTHRMGRAHQLRHSAIRAQRTGSRLRHVWHTGERGGWLCRDECRTRPGARAR